jgi:hypothetical protein
MESNHGGLRQRVNDRMGGSAAAISMAHRKKVAYDNDQMLTSCYKKRPNSALR